MNAPDETPSEAAAAVALLVKGNSHDPIEADRVLTAIDWIATKMDQDCDALHDALGIVSAARS